MFEHRLNDVTVAPRSIAHRCEGSATHCQECCDGESSLFETLHSIRDGHSELLSQIVNHLRNTNNNALYNDHQRQHALAEMVERHIYTCNLNKKRSRQLRNSIELLLHFATTEIITVYRTILRDPTQETSRHLTEIHHDPNSLSTSAVPPHPALHPPSTHIETPSSDAPSDAPDFDHEYPTLDDEDELDAFDAFDDDPADDDTAYYDPFPSTPEMPANADADDLIIPFTDFIDSDDDDLMTLHQLQAEGLQLHAAALAATPAAAPPAVST